MNIAKELQRALELHQAGRLAEAGAIYRDILKVDPDNVDALNLMGVLLQSGGQLSTAISLLEKATQIAPDYLAAWVNLGNALQLVGKLEGAVDAFQKAMTLNPRQPEPANNLASALNQLKRHGEAIDACVMALKSAKSCGLAAPLRSASCKPARSRWYSPVAASGSQLAVCAL